MKLRLPRKIKKKWRKQWLLTGVIDFNKKRFSRKFLHYAYKVIANRENFDIMPLKINRFFDEMETLEDRKLYTATWMNTVMPEYQNMYLRRDL